MTPQATIRVLPLNTSEEFRVTVLIPAYQPNGTLVELVRDLLARGVRSIEVVDDGSGPEYRWVFDELELLAQVHAHVHVLRHAVNLGKGAALKTGMNHILAEDPGSAGIVTADADGQHHPADVVGVCERFAESPDALVLGARSFDSDPGQSKEAVKVPLRSRFGNVLTRRAMHMLVGQNLTDTQTGLRAIPRALVLRLLKVPASGYDFELEMLIAAKHQGIRVVEQPIRTTYEPGNPTSHFHPLRDSMRIYFVLLRFSGISLITAALDNLTFFLVFRAFGSIAIAQATGRIVALLFNYRAVRRAVFFSDERHRVLLPRYLALVAANALISYTGIRILTSVSPIGVFPAKILIESMLFIVNFTIQRDFIFTRHARKP
jgi:glycosyltransferase involved in cell wall biosynthesis